MVDALLSVLTTRKEVHRDASGGDEYACYLDYSDGSICLCICPNSSYCMY